MAPAGLNFGLLGVQADVALVNTGGNSPPLVISAVDGATDDVAPWLSVAAQSVDAAGFGSYRVSVDRSRIAQDGIYTGTVTFRSNANDVLLLDPACQATVAAVAVDAVEGRYAFLLDDIRPGDYLLLAGSDPNNDGVVCGDAEACGGYPALSELAPIQVSGADRTGLDFTTSFALQAP